MPNLPLNGSQSESGVVSRSTHIPQTRLTGPSSVARGRVWLARGRGQRVSVSRAVMRARDRLMRAELGGPLGGEER